jgi:hypothetical protein
MHPNIRILMSAFKRCFVISTRRAACALCEQSGKLEAQACVRDCFEVCVMQRPRVTSGIMRRAPVPARRFGRAKLEAEAFVGDFRDVCVMQRLRVMGDDVRLYKCYPGDWQARARAAVQRAQRARPAAAQARSARSSTWSAGGSVTALGRCCLSTGPC